jgi:hypothetical protein
MLALRQIYCLQTHFQLFHVPNTAPLPNLGTIPKATCFLERPKAVILLLPTPLSSTVCLIDDVVQFEGYMVLTIEIEASIIKNMLLDVLFVGYMLFICTAKRDTHLSTLIQ